MCGIFPLARIDFSLPIVNKFSVSSRKENVYRKPIVKFDKVKICFAGLFCIWCRTIELQGTFAISYHIENPMGPHKGLFSTRSRSLCKVR